MKHAHMQLLTSEYSSLYQVCVAIQKNRESRQKQYKMQPLFMRGAAILSFIPRRGGANSGGMRAIRGHKLNPVAPSFTHKSNHPCAINTDVTTLNKTKSKDRSVVVP